MSIESIVSHKIKPPAKFRVGMLTNLEVGITLLETLWFSYACRIVDKAAQVYNLNEEQVKALTEKFLKRGDYTVLAT